MLIFNTDEEYIDHLQQMLSYEESAKIAWRNRASELEKERNDALAELNRTKDKLLNAPTVDAMEVVRCKECRKSSASKTRLDIIWCNKFGNIMRGCDFCSYGERRTNHES